MAALIAGLVLFLGAHSLTMLRPRRTALIARLGPGPYKGLFSLVSAAGLFLIVTLSVIGQVGSFKLTGKRMFRMAPLHHHFEMKGWPEVQIVVRFWIVQAIFVGLGLGLFYAEWIRRQ